MKIVASVILRQPRAANALIPSGLHFMDSQLRDVNLPGCCGWLVKVDLATLEQIIAWGRETTDGRSNIKSLRAYPEYEAADLQDCEVVEIFRPVAVNSPRVANLPTTFRAWFTCGHCKHIQWEQLADLKLKAVSRHDFQVTVSGHWIASRRTWSLLRDAGLALRPLRGREDFAQITTPETRVRVLARHPVLVETGCTACGRLRVDRQNWMEGDLLSDTYPRITLYWDDFPLTIGEESPDNIDFAPSDVRFGWNYEVAEHPAFQVGQKAPLHEWCFDFGGFPAFFLSRRLMTELQALGATGLDYRPVYVGAQAPLRPEHRKW